MSSEIPSKIAQFEVTFLTSADGGRESLAHLTEGGYMPHLLVAGGQYLGVRFLPSENHAFEAGTPFVIAMEYLYESTVDYSELESADHIAVVEGEQGDSLGQGPVASSAST